MLPFPEEISAKLLSKISEMVIQEIVLTLAKDHQGILILMATSDDLYTVLNELADERGYSARELLEAEQEILESEEWAGALRKAQEFLFDEIFALADKALPE